MIEVGGNIGTVKAQLVFEVLVAAEVMVVKAFLKAGVPRKATLVSCSKGLLCSQGNHS